MAARAAKDPAHDSWSLRPGDLPPEIALAEPLLAGLESNPVYRYMNFRARNLGWRVWLDFTREPMAGWLMTYPFLASLAVQFELAHRRSVGVFLFFPAILILAFGALYWVWRGLAPAQFARSSLDTRLFTDVEVRILGELVACGQTPESAAAGLAGAMMDDLPSIGLRGRGLARWTRRMGLASAGLAGLYLAFVRAAETGAMGSLILASLPMFAAAIGESERLGYAPWRGIHEAAKSASAWRRWIEGSLRERSGLDFGFRQLGRRILVASLFFAAIASALGALAAFAPVILRALEASAITIIALAEIMGMPYTMPILIAVFGLGFARWTGERARRKADKRWKRLAEDMAVITELAAKMTYECPPERPGRSAVRNRPAPS